MTAAENTLQKATEGQSVRPEDPNVRQRRASDPEKSVWVGASAGTGKTKVLTDRVLRLLLPRKDGRPGTAPHRILCLTFTKAAASEMLTRINKILGKWAVMDEAELTKHLATLMARPPTPEDLSEARKLFAAVVDTPGGLKVMTIHSFCQSVLGRFPVEAELPPHFKIVDDAPAAELLARARDRILEEARQSPESSLGKAVRRIAAEQNEDQFGRLLRGLCGERLQLAKIGDDFRAQLCALFGLGEDTDTESLLETACSDSHFAKDALYRACKALANGSKTDQERGLAVQRWLDVSPQERANQIKEYCGIFLTKQGEKRKSYATKAVLAADPEIADILATEAERLIALQDNLNALKCVRLTSDLMMIGRGIINGYQELKEARGLLDYDDLILKTLGLLQRTDMAPWVLYKLDGGLDHVLIDEAQDTNPEQWQIIQNLCEDFFSGEGAREDVTRTIFTVGDEKQSIYSFQRAAPREFQRMHAYFAEKAAAQEEKMDTSFRSAKTVLDLVDKVFEPPAIRAGLGRDNLKHHSHRVGHAGIAELWPVFAPDENTATDEEPWTPPTSIIEAQSGQARLAEHIGKTIKNWLDNGEILESAGRKVQPGDIMVLMRTRTAFVNQLVRALKTRNIPVSGVDRMILGEQLAVMDLLALAQFALLPDDDLSLACVLKSPLIGLNEDRLFDLAYNRSFSLWKALEQAEPDIALWLGDLIRHAAADHPYEFFSRILQRPCPADDISGMRAMLKRLGKDAVDPLDEFLNAALSYERDNIPTLQGFLVWQKQGDQTIKRELEEAGGAVRIMTVHGSKGLQAPIVILPDTTRTSASKKLDSLLWPDKTGLDIPLWAARSEEYPDVYKQARAALDTQQEEEYRRLLYVALTRAEDRLYIAGCQGKKKPMDECWYNYIAAAFDNLEGVEEWQDEEGRTIKRFSNPQTAPVKTKDEEHEEKSKHDLTQHDWLFKKAGAEPVPPQPLTPSRPSELEPAVRSPLSSGEEYRFKRGNLTHKLLQILPDLPASEQEAAATNFVSRPAHDLPPAMQAEIVRETMAILQHPEYAPLFGPDSLAEVPVTGYVNGRLVSAQIDRLLVTADEIQIIDFKTNRPPPTEEADIPPLYRDQLASYRDIVSHIWPDRAVRCFLLWTDGPRLLELKSL